MGSVQLQRCPHAIACPDAESLHVAGGEQSVELLLVDDRDAQFLGLRGLRTGIGSDDHPIRLPAHRSGGLAATAFDGLLSRFAGEMLKGAGDHHALAFHV